MTDFSVFNLSECNEEEYLETVACLYILGRVGFFFFDRITIIIMMTMMIMIRITREMRMIERVDRDFTTKES